MGLHSLSLRWCHTFQIDPHFLEGSLGLHDLTFVNNTFEGVTHCTSEKDCIMIGPTVRAVHASDNRFQPTDHPASV